MLYMNFFIILFGIFLIIIQEIRINTRSKYLYLWLNIFFILLIISTVINLIYYLNFISISYFPIFSSLWMPIAFVFVLLHAYIYLGKKNTVILFSLSLFFGFISEYLGVKYGLFFGNYIYVNLIPSLFGTIPIMTPISWAIIVYMCYGITNSIFFCGGGKKPQLNEKNTNSYIFLIILILSLIDGLCAMNLDMVIDPIAVLPSVAAWIWIDGGPYFNVPISNFFGWFIIVFIVTLLFRVYDSVNYINSNIKNIKLISYFPILYFLYFLQHASFAIKHGNHIEIVLIGFSTMFPFIIISLLLLLLKKM